MGCIDLVRCVLVLRCGFGVVSVCRLRQCLSLHTDTTPQPKSISFPSELCSSVVYFSYFVFGTALVSNIGPRTCSRNGRVYPSRHLSEYYCKTDHERFITLPDNYSTVLSYYCIGKDNVAEKTSLNKTSYDYNMVANTAEGANSASDLKNFNLRRSKFINIGKIHFNLSLKYIDLRQRAQRI